MGASSSPRAAPSIATTFQVRTGLIVSFAEVRSSCIKALLLGGETRSFIRRIEQGIETRIKKELDGGIRGVLRTRSSAALNVSLSSFRSDRYVVSV
jgi:hypothetical protein